MAKGFLLVTMEPPASLEEEFNDWYDTEHLPQRRGLPEFESGSRWACLQGWPRWVAIYDMASPDSVKTDAYRAVSGANSTPWSKRVLPRTMGRERIVARQTLPGDATARPVSEVTRLVIARFSGEANAAALAGLQARAAALPHFLQLRAFAATEHTAPETWVVAEYGGPIPLAEAESAFARCGDAGARLVNIYAPYWRNPS